MNINRVHSIDALRGFALLGILIVNMMHFQYATEHLGVLSSKPYFNEAMLYVIKILFQGSFLTLFAFLFGFSIMQFTYSRRNKLLPQNLPIFKRGLALFIIGLVHYIFIWPGDILASYGVMILFFLALVHAEFKVLKIFMYIFFPIYFLLNTAMRFSSNSSTDLNNQIQHNLIYSTGTYSEVFNLRLTFGLGEIYFSPLVNFFLHMFNVVMVPLVLIPFAIYGMYVSKQQLENIKPFKATSVKIWLPITIIGVALKSGVLLGNFIGMVCLTLGSILTTYGYMHMFLTLHQNVFSEKLKLVFESVGKMTISNYLAQSVILTLLFSHYGLGLSGKVGLFGGLIIAIVLFVLQGITSYFIIKKFKQGPMEYLIRKFIYSGDKKAVKKLKQDVTV